METMMRLLKANARKLRLVNWSLSQLPLVSLFDPKDTAAIEVDATNRYFGAHLSAIDISAKSDNDLEQ